MKIEDQRGNPLPEATVSVGDEEIIDLLQGLADVIEGKRDHLHFNQLGGHSWWFATSLRASRRSLCDGRWIGGSAPLFCSGPSSC